MSDEKVDKLMVDREKYNKARQEAYDNMRRLEGILAYIDSEIKAALPAPPVEE